MTTPLALQRIEPTGKRKAFGHIHTARGPHVWGEIEIDDYPRTERTERLRALRVQLGLGLRVACKRLGISAVEYSLLERGGYACDWDRAEHLLRGGAR